MREYRVLVSIHFRVGTAKDRVEPGPPPRAVPVRFASSETQGNSSGLDGFSAEERPA
jgi:hypothetical protein